jgi:hypothetical protein
LQGESVRADDALAYGNAYWGFSWRGSWCGASARKVLVSLHGGAGITGPVHGRSPGCDGTSTAVVYRGIDGGPGYPVQPAPPSWERLRARLQVPDVPAGSDQVHPTVTLANPTGASISLAPCPSYTLLLESNDGAEVNGYDHPFPCPRKARVIGAHRSVSIPLPPQTFDRPAHGGKVTVQIGMAAIPQAKTTADVAA